MGLLISSGFTVKMVLGFPLTKALESLVTILFVQPTHCPFLDVETELVMQPVQPIISKISATKLIGNLKFKNYEMSSRLDVAAFRALRIATILV